MENAANNAYTTDQRKKKKIVATNLNFSFFSLSLSMFRPPPIFSLLLLKLFFVTGVFLETESIFFGVRNLSEIRCRISVNARATFNSNFEEGSEVRGGGGVKMEP